LRHIDPERVEAVVSSEWLDKASSAIAEVSRLEDSEKSKGITKYSDLWRELAPLLGNLTSMKCWYCESIEKRSDNPIDHFRPKGRVAECEGMTCGYWWLAFDWRNYRFCCTFCNSRRIDDTHGTDGGKQDHFPLRDEQKRAKTRIDETCDEQPLLLDPCRSADPLLLWFDEDGKPMPNPRYCMNDTSKVRVRESIRLYHLDHELIVVARRRLFKKIQRLANEADEMFLKILEEDCPTAHQAFENAVRSLRETLEESAELSSTARAYLIGLRVTSGAAEAALKTLQK
jgi:uncharacterized protein (TIGR02646 family)